MPQVTATRPRRAGTLRGYGPGLRAIAPLLPAVLAFGISFGVLAQSAGMEGWASIVMSLTTFAGSAQFAAVSVLGGGGTAAAAIVAAILLNARYGPMALAAADVFRGGPVRRLLEAQLLVDESWALAQRDGRFDRRLMIGAGLGPLGLALHCLRVRHEREYASRRMENQCSHRRMCDR